MKTKFYSFLIISLLLPAGLFAQLTLNVGDNLNQLVQDADDGSVIIIKQGMHDAQDVTVSVTGKSITFRGEEGDSKPLVYVKQFDVAGTDINVIFEGLELTGATLVDSLTGEFTDTVLVADYLINLTADNVSTNNIILRDCIIRSFNRSIIRGDRSPAHTADTIMLDDCIAFDFRGGGDYGPFRFKSNITINHFIIKNTTMYNFLNKLIDFQDVVSSEMKIEIDQCTFYAWGGGKDGQYLFDIQDNDQARFSITNCILGKTNSENVLVRAFRFLPEAVTEISTSVMTVDFIVDTTGAYDRVPWDVDEWNETGVDPEFARPDTGNFTLPDDSPLREMNSEGGPIGDPRWAPPIQVSVRDVETDVQFTIYPVPTSDKLNVLSKKTGTISIFNSTGQIMREMRVESGTVHVINVHNWIKGVYFLRMNGENGVYKFLVK